MPSWLYLLYKTITEPPSWGLTRSLPILQSMAYFWSDLEGDMILFKTASFKLT